MKAKLFQTIYAVLKFYRVPLSRIMKLSNYVNLVIFSVTSKGKYVLRDDTSFIFAESFVKYFLFQNEADCIGKLKKGLDQESQELIDEILKRHIYIYTHGLLEYERFFTDEERKEQVMIDKARQKKSVLPSFVDEVVSYYHNGLKLVPQEMVDLMKNRDVIDAGAFLGDSSVIFNKEYTFRNIFAFEPEKQNYEKLEVNIKQFNLLNVEAINEGVGKTSGVVHIKSQGPGSYIDDHGDQSITITTIDKFVMGRNLDIGLIKMDIEGAEYDALLGAIETIKKQQPLLLISIYHRGKDFFEIKPMLEELVPSYRFVVRKFNPFSLMQEIMLIAYPRQ